MTSVPLAEAKNRLSGYVSEVERTHDRVTITRHGRTISADDLAALEETVDLAAGRIADNAALHARYSARRAGRVMFASQRWQNVTLLGCRKRSQQDAGYSPSADNPDRLGAYLRGQLAGLRSARRGSYRIIYKVDEDRDRIDIVHIDHRGDVDR